MQGVPADVGQRDNVLINVSGLSSNKTLLWGIVASSGELELWVRHEFYIEAGYYYCIVFQWSHIDKVIIVA